MIWRLVLLSLAATCDRTEASWRRGRSYEQQPPRLPRQANATIEVPTSSSSLSSHVPQNGFKGTRLPVPQVAGSSVSLPGLPPAINGGGSATILPASSANPPVLGSLPPSAFVPPTALSTPVPDLPKTLPPGFKPGPATTPTPILTSDAPWKNIPGWNTTDASELTRAPNATSSSWITSSTSSVDEELNPNPGFCTVSVKGAPSTTWSVVYTTTTTILANETDAYTPPFAPVVTPTPCKSPLRLQHTTSSTSTFSPYDFWVSCTTIRKIESCTTQTLYMVSWASSDILPGATEIGNTPLLAGPTVTFVTTDKNPSTVVETETNAPKLPTGFNQGSKVTAPGGIATNLNIPTVGPQSIKMGSKPDFSVTVGPTVVIINEQTITLPSDQTTKVAVDGETFLINPSEVVGAGATVTRPTPMSVPLPTYTSTNVADLPIVISSSQAIIGGATFAIGPSPTTVTIGGQTISIGKNGIGLGGSVTVGGPPEQTEIVVAGGEMITAIGRSVVVVRSTTFTYGPSMSSRTEVIDDDTIVIGPSGVVVHSTTVGGLRADVSATMYDIAGGATITQIGSSKVVIAGSTYTVGPGTGRTTTVVGGETITIGPEGVSVSTLSFPYPFGPTVVTTIKPAATATAPAASQTSKKGAAGRLRGPLDLGGLGLCIATGVWFLGLAF